MRRFLLVDDEINILHALQRTLRHHIIDEEVRIELFTEPLLALERIGEIAFDFVISDFNMPQMNGVDFLKAVKDVQPDAVRLMLSASADFGTVMHAVNEAEVFRYITKPWVTVELKEIIRVSLARRDRLIEDRHLADELRVQRDELTAQEREARLLEEDEPGITKVNWGPDGSVMLD